jgi:hypothetical protein
MKNREVISQTQQVITNRFPETIKNMIKIGERICSDALGNCNFI